MRVGKGGGGSGVAVRASQRGPPESIPLLYSDRINLASERNMAGGLSVLHYRPWNNTKSKAGERGRYVRMLRYLFGFSSCLEENAITSYRLATGYTIE
jgi:hypothetical protein